MPRFSDRSAAGRQLAEALRGYAENDPIVLALPRGGVPVAFEVARALDAPLDVCVVRKIGAPGYPEFGLGAVAEGGEVYLSPELSSELGLSRAELRPVIEQKELEVEERVRRFRGRPLPEMRGHTVLLIDDGIATGGTAMAAIRALRKQRPAQLVLAVPVASAESVRELGPHVDRLIALLVPPHLDAVGNWYADFAQVSDEDVDDLLAEARRLAAPAQRWERAGSGEAT
jgi:putative phosphoribosyl transferase